MQGPFFNARYITAADAEHRRHLPLRLGQIPIQAVSAADYLRLPLRQTAIHQLPNAHPLLSVRHIRKHGVVTAHHIQQAQCIPNSVALDGVG